MALSYKEKVRRAQHVREIAIAAVYASVEGQNTPLQECLAAATPEVRGFWEKAVDRYREIEDEAVAAGKAYRGTYGMLIWYS